MKRMLIGLIIGSAVGLSSLGLTSQKTQPPAKPERKLAIAVYLTVAAPGQTASIKNAFGRMGFADAEDLYGWGHESGPIKTIQRPSSELNGLILSLDYLFAPNWSLGVMVGNDNTRTIGYSKTLYTHVDLATSMTVLAPLFHRQEGVLKIGLGPAIYFLTTKTEFAPECQTTRLGILADASLATSARRRIFAEARVQYRLLFGSVQIPSFSVDYLDYAVPGGVSAMLTFPAFDMKYSHLSFTVGLGVHI